MKKFFALLIAVIMVVSVIPALAEETATVTVNGEDATFAQSVIVKGDTPYVPLRPIASVMELETAWDNDLRCAIAKGTILDITVPIGEKYVKNANMKKSISAENIIYNDYTYMPVDALAAFDITYKWDAENNALALSVPVLNGKYYVIRHKATGLVMMPDGAATTDGPLIRLVEADGSDAQLWQFMTRGENLYRPINQKSLRSMDMPNWRTDEGLELIQYGNTEGTNQWVHPVKNEDGTYQLIIHHSMMYLGATENNTVAQYNEFDPERDSYELVEVVKKVEDEEGTKVEIEKADPLSGKYVSIVNASGTDNVITVVDSSKEADAKLKVAIPEDTDSEVWLIVKVQDGYSFVNKDSYLALTGMGAGGNVRQKASTGADGQVYLLEEAGDGYYYLKSKASGFYLTEYYGTLIETVFRGDSTQAFKFDEPYCNTDVYEKDNFGGKYYEIKHSSGKVMGVPEDVIKTNALIKALDDTDVDTNVWALVSMGGGKYVISNKVSIQSFDVPNGKKNEGLEIIQYESNFGANQIYILEDAGDNKFRIKCQVSDLYLTLTENDTFAQYALKDDDSQIFTFEEKGASTKKMVGAVAQMFLIRGEDDVTSAKVQWNVVHGATHYDIYRSVDGGDFEFLTASKGQIIDDYYLEIGKEYKYAVYAIENDTMIDYAITDAVAPYTLPADLSQSSNLSASDVKRPNTMIANDGTYYHFQQWGIDGVPGFGRVMMQTSKDDITYTEWKEVLNYKEILAHETCQNFTQCRFESVNFVYNKKADTFAFVAHFEADGGYGTAMISIASMKSTDERMTFRGAYRPEGDDCRDLNVFVDEDSSGYIIAAANNNANLGIYKLNEDWSAIEGRLCFVSMYKWRELPSVLKKDGTYYLFSSGTAGWYPTQGMVATATDMGGPWSELKHVGNTTTFSSQSGTMFTLHEGGNNHIMATYRWMFGWQDATNKSTTNRRYPVSVSNGYAFYDFFDELLYNWANDVLIPVQTGRILSQDKAVKTVDTEGYAAGNAANDGHYRTSWYQKENNWPFTWEADLGKVSHLTQLQVSWLIWNGSEAYYNYILEASVDGENWTKVLDKSEGYTDYGFTCDNIDGYGRYVRLTVLNAKPRNSERNTYPAQLQEVKILGK